MVDSSEHPALIRILDDPKARDAVQLLSEGLSGSDVTTLLISSFATRASSVQPAELMRQYGRDRFVAASTADALAIARIELVTLETAAPIYEPVALAPLAPLGCHHAMGGTPQNNVISTSRLTEVTADPTNSLALEAAKRRAELLRGEPRSVEPVKLVGVHRVVRAQRFEGARSFAHFSLAGLVSAGRDQGNYSFELESLFEQIGALVRVVRELTSAEIEIQLSAFNRDLAAGCADLCERFTSQTVTCRLDRERTHGRGYYQNLCFKLNVNVDGEVFELGDGGDVGWTQDLLQNRKERLVIGGMGLERLAILIAEHGGG